MGEEGNLSSGSTPRRDHPEYYKGNIPWVSSGELDYNIIKNTHETITLLAIEKTNLKIHPKDTFLFAITGLEAKRTRGRCAILGVSATTNQSCMAFNESNSLLSKFLFYYFSLFGDKIIFSLAQGTKQQSLNLHLSKKIKIPIPEYNEQQKIASILSRVDALIEATQHIIEKTERLKKGLMQRLLTRGIDHSQFKNIKLLFGKYENIPKKWKIRTFEEIFKFLSNGTNSRSDLQEHGEIGYIHYGDIHTKWNSVLDCNLEKIPFIGKTKVEKLPLLKEGDLIIADASEDHEGSGASVLLRNVKNRKVVSGLHTIALRSIDTNISSEFKRYLLSIKFVKNQIIAYVVGISVYGLSKNNLRKVRIPLPPFEEQQKLRQSCRELMHIFRRTMSTRKR